VHSKPTRKSEGAQSTYTQAATSTKLITRRVISGCDNTGFNAAFQWKKHSNKPFFDGVYNKIWLQAPIDGREKKYRLEYIVWLSSLHFLLTRRACRRFT
jgi:hypothetical protein